MAAAPFAAVLEEARGELTASFRLRQRLDDAEPEDDATRRSMLAEIISRCEAANAKLDDQAEDFDRLRDLERNAPQVLAEVGRVIVHGVAIKPGKPVILAMVGAVPVIGLPGYPVSAVLTMHNPPGQRMLAFGLAWSDYMSVLLGLVLLAVARVMSDAVRAAEENAGFV